MTILEESSRLGSMLDLDPWSFDQTQAGWRTLPANQQISILKTYIQKYVRGNSFTPDTPEGKREIDAVVLVWHLGQVLAFADNYPEAVKYMSMSKMSDDTEWNDYVDATIAFLKQDKRTFDLLSAKSNYNSDTIMRLKQGWGKPYKDVY